MRSASKPSSPTSAFCLLGRSRSRPPCALTQPPPKFSRTKLVDDETIAAPDGLRDIVPAITPDHPDVRTLIERQETDRRGMQVGIDPDRERAVLTRMTEDDALFAPAVRDAARTAADPSATDRLTGLRAILSRNGVIASLGLFLVGGAAAGIVGGRADAALLWAVRNADALTSLALSMGDDIDWWARTILDRIKALLEARTLGPRPRL